MGDNTSITNLIGKSTNITIDYLIISHKHIDHVQGLASLVKKAKSGVAITINNLYVNGLDFTASEVFGKRLSEVNKSKIKIKKTYYFGIKGKVKSDASNNAATNFFKNWKKSTVNYVNNIETISVLGTGCQIIILPPLKDYGNSTTAENNNSLITIIKDNVTKNDNTKSKNFKIILPGDIQSDAMAKICSTAEYSKYLIKDGFKNIIYKVSHHGKARQHDFFKKIPDGTIVRLTNSEEIADHNLLNAMALYADYTSSFNFSMMFFNERNLIKLIQPKIIIGSTWMGLNDKTKGSTIRRGLNCYDLFITDTVKRNHFSKITLKDSFGGKTVKFKDNFEFITN